MPALAPISACSTSLLLPLPLPRGPLLEPKSHRHHLYLCRGEERGGGGAQGRGAERGKERGVMEEKEEERDGQRERGKERKEVNCSRA